MIQLGWLINYARDWAIYSWFHPFTSLCGIVNHKFDNNKSLAMIFIFCLIFLSFIIIADNRIVSRKCTKPGTHVQSDCLIDGLHGVAFGTRQVRHQIAKKVYENCSSRLRLFFTWEFSNTQSNTNHTSTAQTRSQDLKGIVAISNFTLRRDSCLGHAIGGRRTIDVTCGQVKPC